MPTEEVSEFQFPHAQKAMKRMVVYATQSAKAVSTGSDQSAGKNAPTDLETMVATALSQVLTDEEPVKYFKYTKIKITVKAILQEANARTERTLSVKDGV